MAFDKIRAQTEIRNNNDLIKVILSVPGIKLLKLV